MLGPLSAFYKISYAVCANESGDVMCPCYTFVAGAQTFCAIVKSRS